MVVQPGVARWRSRTNARTLPIEASIAVEFNGLGHAVLMATPGDLIDLACGFALSERLIERATDIVEVVVHPAENGALLRIFLQDERAPDVLERVRHRVSDSSCGMCGIENLEQALRLLPMVRATSEATAAVASAGDLLGTVTARSRSRRRAEARPMRGRW